MAILGHPRGSTPESQDLEIGDLTFLRSYLDPQYLGVRTPQIMVQMGSTPRPIMGGYLPNIPLYAPLGDPEGDIMWSGSDPPCWPLLTLRGWIPRMAIFRPPRASCGEWPEPQYWLFWVSTPNIPNMGHHLTHYPYRSLGYGTHPVP